MSEFFLLPDPSTLFKRAAPSGNNPWASFFEQAPRADSEDEMLGKPTQVAEYKQWANSFMPYMLQSGIHRVNFYRGCKADGHSTILQCEANGTCRLSHRTREGAVLLDGLKLEGVLHKVAFDLRVKFKAELCAFYEGKEAGFLEVLPMLEKFKQNGCRNVGPFKLQIRIFGVYSARPSPSSGERSGSGLYGKQLAEFCGQCIVPGNGLVDCVPSETFRVELADRAGGKGYVLRFSRQSSPDAPWRTITEDPQAFFDLCIREADALGIEGWVLTMPPDVLPPSKQTRKDEHGAKLLRFRHAVKVKREFRVNLAACKVRHTGKQEEEIWLYRKDTAQGRVVYAGLAKDNVRLASYLEERLCDFQHTGQKASREALYSLEPDVLRRKRGSFVFIEAICTNLSKTHYSVIGLKYDMRRVDHSLLNPFEWLSDTEQVAKANPHFCQTKAASDAFALAVGRGQPKPSKKRPQVLTPEEVNARYAAFVAKRAREEKEASEEEEEEDEPRRPLTKRADTPPREEPPEVQEALENAAFAKDRSKPFRTLANPPLLYVDNAGFPPLEGAFIRLKARFLGAELVFDPTRATLVVTTKERAGAVRDGVRHVEKGELQAVLRAMPVAGAVPVDLRSPDQMELDAFRQGGANPYRVLPKAPWTYVSTKFGEEERARLEALARFLGARVTQDLSCANLCVVVKKYEKDSWMGGSRFMRHIERHELQAVLRAMA